MAQARSALAGLFMAQARSDLWPKRETQEDIYFLYVVCLKYSGTILFMRNGLKFLNQVETKTTRFEIVFKSLARFSTQFRIKESFKLLLAI